MVPPLSEIRERRERWAQRPADLVEILREGSRRAQSVARQTMDEVRAAVGLTP
jgi:tryptophanyl-tRNA synthetase